MPPMTGSPGADRSVDRCQRDAEGRPGGQTDRGPGPARPSRPARRRGPSGRRPGACRRAAPSSDIPRRSAQARGRGDDDEVRARRREEQRAAARAAPVGLTRATCLTSGSALDLQASSWRPGQARPAVSWLAARSAAFRLLPTTVGRAQDRQDDRGHRSTGRRSTGASAAGRAARSARPVVRDVGTGASPECAASAGAGAAAAITAGAMRPGGLATTAGRRPTARIRASVRSRSSGRRRLEDGSRTRPAEARRLSASAEHAGQPARWPASAAASGVSPAASRSSPPGWTAASSSSSRASRWSIIGPTAPTTAPEPSSGHEPGPERVAHPQQRAPGAGLDGADRPAQPLGDLALAQLVAIGEDEDRPLDVGQLGQRLGERRPQLGLGEERGRAHHRLAGSDDLAAREQPLERRRVALVGQGNIGDRHGRRSAAERAQPIDRPVAGDRQQPGRQRAHRSGRTARPGSTARERFPEPRLRQVPDRSSAGARWRRPRRHSGHRAGRGRPRIRTPPPGRDSESSPVIGYASCSALGFKAGIASGRCSNALE